jgi:hypothetical protein
MPRIGLKAIDFQGTYEHLSLKYGQTKFVSYRNSEKNYPKENQADGGKNCLPLYPQPSFLNFTLFGASLPALFLRASS